MSGVWYVSREDVKRALDVAETARSNSQIDRAIEAASRSIDGDRPGDGFLRRRFYPQVDTRYFDWPTPDSPRSWRLWLDQHELISVTTLTSGGVTIAASDYLLRPYDGPPFTHVEIDLASSAAFTSGSTHQQAVAITGTFGHSANTAPAGALAEALDDSETGVDITDSSLIGIGHLIKVDSERMIVTGKAMLDTGVNIHSSDSLSASVADVSITMSTTTGAPAVDEVILVDSERMLVVDVAGSTLTVKRAWDGSVLAGHAGGADIYAPRTLTVERGALGTTAAAHSSSTAVTRHVVPGPVVELCLAEALNNYLQAGSGYARTIGSGDAEREAGGRGLRDIRNQAYTALGRKARTRAV